LYLKEMEFRYNNRDQDLYDLLIQCLNEYNKVASIK